MHLHAFVDGTGWWNYAYYIVENEERYIKTNYAALSTNETEMLAMLDLLRSNSALRASRMTVFSDSQAAIWSARRPAFRFKDLDGPLEKLRIAIQEAMINLPYKPRIVWIEDSFNLAHRVTRNKRVLLETGSKLPHKVKPNSRRGKRISQAQSDYLKSQQLGTPQSLLTN